MKIQRLTAGLLLASTLLLGGCPQAPAPDAAPAADAAAPSATDTPSAGTAGGTPLLAGTITARFGTSPESAMTASECSITNNGANGAVRSDDGAFHLSWADGAYQLNWTHSAGTYQGPVTGTVQMGGSVSFTGNANGQAVQGFAVCFQG